MTKSNAVPRKPSEPGFATRPAARAGGIPARRALVAGLLFAPLALLSAAYSSAVVLDTREPKVSNAIYSELPKAKIRLGDLEIAEAFSDMGTEEVSQGGAGRLPPTAAELAAQLPAATRARIEAQALSGLTDTPYAGGALRQLAFVEADPVRRRALLDLARRVSRRDVSAAAQVAELQLRGGDLAEGLATLDQALQISDALDARIFPLMLTAARLPEFEQPFRARLARDPAWAERFARHAVTDPASAPLFARVVGGFPKESRARSIDYGAQLIDQLASDLEPTAAFAAYEAYSHGKQGPAAFGPGALPPLDWKLVDNIDTGARMLRPEGPVIELFAGPRRTGEAARIMLRLQPGTYALGLALADARGRGGALVLTRTCLVDGRELAQSEYSAAIAAPRVTLPFKVPADCPYQSLRLGIEANAEAVSVLVEDATFRRARPVS